MSERLQEITAALEANEVANAIELLGDDQSLIEQGGAYWMTIGAKNNNVDMMVRLNELGCPLNGTSFAGTPLAAASTVGATEAVCWLLDRGVTIDSDESSVSPLQQAVEADQVETVKLFIKAGADPLELIGWAKVSLLDVAEENSATATASYLRSIGLEPKRSPPATEPERPPSRALKESECRKIERALSLTLPNEYRNVLKSLPSGLHYETGCADGFIYLPSDIIAETESAREFKETEWPEHFPTNMLVIGGDGGGDLFCVNADEDGSVVYRFDHENGCIAEGETWELSEFLVEMTDRV